MLPDKNEKKNDTELLMTVVHQAATLYKLIMGCLLVVFTPQLCRVAATGSFLPPGLNGTAAAAAVAPAGVTVTNATAAAAAYASSSDKTGVDACSLMDNIKREARRRLRRRRPAATA